MSEIDAGYPNSSLRASGIETRLNEVLKENSVLRTINEMILEDPGDKAGGCIQKMAPLKNRIQELELFVFNLSSEVSVYLCVLILLARRASKART